VRDLGRWFDPGWWRQLGYSYPEHLVVFGGLLAVGLAVGGYVSVSALGSEGSADRSALISTISKEGGGAAEGVGAEQVVRTGVETRPLSDTGGERLIRTRPVTVSHVVTRTRTVTVVQSRTLNQTHTVVRTKPSRSRTVTVTVAGPTHTVTATVTVTTTCKRHCEGG
jgi:hypothetical protein